MSYEKFMWIGLGIAMACLFVGPICTLIFQDGLWLIFGSGSSLIVWTICCLKKDKNPGGIV